MPKHYAVAGQKEPTGPRKACPDDRLRVVVAPDVPAIHVSQLSWPGIAVRRTACFRTPMSRPSRSYLVTSEGVDARDKPGHDVLWNNAPLTQTCNLV